MPWINAYRVLVLTLIAFALVLSAYAATDALVWREPMLARSLQQTPTGGIFEPLADFLAQEPLEYGLVTIAAGVAIVRRNYALAAAALFVASATLLNQPLKELVDRARPSVDQLDVREPAKSSGFPSGHTMDAVLLYGYCMLVMHRCAPRSVAVGCAAVASAAVVLIGWDRVYDGAHWPSDVAGGAAIGALLLAAAVAVPATLFRLAERHAEVGLSVRRGLGWNRGDRLSPRA